jgi:lipoprotein-releasing system permease protein
MTSPVNTAPFAPFEILLATRYLRPKAKDGIISVIAVISFLGIMLGVATLITVLGIMNGFREELYSRLLGLNGHVIVSKLGGGFTDFEETMARLKTVPAVASVSPIVTGEALMTNAEQEVGSLAVYVRGMRTADMAELAKTGAKFTPDPPTDFNASETIILGARLAKSLKVEVGGEVQMLTSKGKSTPFGRKPNNKAYRVAALVDFGMAEADSALAFLPLREGQLFFEVYDAVSMLEVQVTTPDKTRELLPLLQNAAGQSFYLSDWQDRNKTIFDIIDVQRDLMVIIVGLIMLVAALNIISGMMMLVKQKGKAIAILRTMGATKGAIMRVFLMTGASIGIAGTFAGLAVGLLLSGNIENVRYYIQKATGRVVFDPTVYLVSKLVARIDPWETAAIVAAALALSVLATLYPSWRASRLDPVQALRYE